MPSPLDPLIRSRKYLGRYQYEIAPGRWVSRQRVNQTRNRFAWRARKLVAQALRNRTMARKPCERCGLLEGVQAHHDDYRQPYLVTWLCAAHHRAHHAIHGRATAPEWVVPYANVTSIGRPRGHSGPSHI